MNAGLLAQTIASGALACAVILGFLYRFAPRRARWPQIAAGVVFLDQASKWLVVGSVKGGPAHSFLGGAMHVGYYTNYLQGFGATSPSILCMTLVGVVGGIRLFQMLLERRYLMSATAEIALALMLGGLATIAVERACTGFVVDFLEFGPHSAYVYNFADLAVLAGGLTLCLRGITVLPRAVEEELAGTGADGGAE